MKYLLVLATVLITASANARLSCSTTCTLKGNGIEESQTYKSFDGGVHGLGFQLNNYNGYEIVGGFWSNGDPGVSCDNQVMSVWVKLNGESLSQDDSEIFFNIDGIPHKLSCEIKTKGPVFK